MLLYIEALLERSHTIHGLYIAFAIYLYCMSKNCRCNIFYSLKSKPKDKVMFSRQQSKLLPFLTCLFFTGCSSFDSKDEQPTKEANLQTQLSEWESLKPEIKELVLLKTEIKTLITDLSLLADETNESLITSSPETVILNAPLKKEVINSTIITPPTLSKNITTHQNEPIIKATDNNTNNYIAKTNELNQPIKKIPLPSTQPLQNKIKNKITDKVKNKQVAIQLGSYSTSKATELSWKNLQEKFNEKLNDKKVVIEPFNMANKKQIYRLKVTPFINKNDALLTCIYLKQFKQACLVTTTNE